MQNSITYEDLAAFSDRFAASTAGRVAMHAVTNNGVLKSALDQEAMRRNPHHFSTELTQGDITSQKKSGRCWMFAATNCMRYQVIHRFHLETFELSQNYPLFYDKLEKANYFLESILETLSEPVEGRLVSHLLRDPLGDGGQWDMFVNLVKKYGMVPKDAMPETAVSGGTAEMTAAMTEKLREDACILRAMHGGGKALDDLRAAKDSMMSDIYGMLCICLGRPPQKFDFEFTDKDGKFTRDEGLTPQAFFEKYVAMDLDDYVSLINAPTADKPFYRSYSVKYLGNVAGGRPVRYLNLPVERLKQAAAAQMKDGEPVWFGCDVGKSSDRDSGIMDTKLYDRESLFGVRFGMDKGQRLTYGQSLMTHAMVLTGVDEDSAGKFLRWRVENSWGKDCGKDGYFVMSDDWFTEYTYQVVVHKKYLTAEELAAYEADPIMLEPWDPMGSLAK